MLDMSVYNTLTWGCELELTGNTRANCATVVASHFGVSYYHEGGTYDKYLVVENSTGVERTWTIMRDSSITPLRKEGGTTVSASDYYRVEFVTPVMNGSREIDGYQEIVRKLRKKGFFPSISCGCHIHVGIKDLEPSVLVHVLNQVHSKQDLLLKALGIDSNSPRYRYMKKIPTSLVSELRDKKVAKKSGSDALKALSDIWYNSLGDSYGMNTRYPSSRYHMVNLTRGLVPTSRFYLGTCEFRMFTSTVHAGRLRAYIQLCLLLVNYCTTIKKSNYKVTNVDSDESEKYKLRCWLLKLGAKGNEFKTLRLFLLEKFGEQSSAWRRGVRV